MKSDIEVNLKDGRTIFIRDSGVLKDAPNDMLFIESSDKRTSYLFPNSQIIYMKETRRAY